MLRAVLTTNGCLLFFFFQAEDGIRDLTVTGVQTCALPILNHVEAEIVVGDLPGGIEYERRSWNASVAKLCDRITDFAAATPDVGRDPRTERSEERRVGKECRSRWSPYH